MGPLRKLRALIGQQLIQKSEQVLNNRVNRPIPCDKGRMTLAGMLPKESVGIELGVAGGYFSDALLRCSNLRRLFSIDAWADHHDSEEYFAGCSPTGEARQPQCGAQNVPSRMRFFLFDDESIDFIYLDAYGPYRSRETGD